MAASMVERVSATELWLVRHGETDWSAAQRFCGWSDPPLSERGRAMAASLRAELESIEFDSIVSSTSQRAVETARLAHGEPRTDERLRELDFGDIEGMTWTECSDDIRTQLLDYETFQAPNGESVEQLIARVSQALAELGPGRHLVVTHGGVIRFLLGRAGVTDYPALATIHRVTLTLDPGLTVSSVQRSDL
jgi:2,3-bisphosphoglycerate-dependent phosphoglycerate mutase